MNQNRNNRNRNNENDEGNWTGWKTAGVVGGLAAIAGGLYYLSRGNNTEEQPVASNTSSRTAGRDAPSSEANNSASSTESEQTDSNMSDYLSSLIQRISTDNSASGSSSQNGGSSTPSRRGVPKSSVPDNPTINNIDSLLHDIYLRYIAFNDDDFENYYRVVHQIFLQLHNKMKEVDLYYKKYSSTVQFAGSHPDRLRINKPDEFDIDIVIGLPLSMKNNPLNPEESDFIFEPKDPGFTQLKVGRQFERLPYRDGNEWENNKAAYEWKDDKNYLLNSKFMNWFKSLVNRALNEFVENCSLPPTFYVTGVPYTVSKSESGPAMTMYIENRARNFKLDVDLVPALRFPINRWPICSNYRSIPPVCAGKDYWMVVPKPNKAGYTEQDKTRAWRVAMHEQEAMLMYNVNHMKQAIRFIKKLRDAQNMKHIASYYIKTMFFWEAMKHQDEPAFWNQSPAILFKIMLKNFYDYLVAGRIPYFWNKNNNLIGKVDSATLNRYATIVGKLLTVLESPTEYKQVAEYLLTDAEFMVYNEKYLHI